MAVAPWIVSDALWQLIEPLLPVKERRFPNRAASGCRIGKRCRGSCFVLHREISWTHLPSELGFGTFAWLHQFKRLLVRYDRRADIHEAFLAIGCGLVCFRRLRSSS